ncbi:hypothetical protein D910_08324 [Dendroctonus ponderosae]
MAKEINETFITAECITEFDAVHPRFQPEDEAVALRYQQEHYYFCQQCNLFFAPTVTGLKVHFKGDMVKHKTCGSCFYCQGPVYEYSINSERKVYHSCKRSS